MNYEVTQVYIDNCSSESDLGEILGSNLLIANHIDKAVKKANQTLGIIKRTSTFLYKALVRPHLEHGNVIWYPCPKRHSAAVIKFKEELQNR